VTICTNLEGPGTFALIFSVSHMVVDGGGAYRLMGLLDGRAKVKRFNWERQPSFRYSPELEEIFGKEKIEWQNSKERFAGLGKMMKPPSPPGEYAFYRVDKSWVAAKKKAAVEADPTVPYVSTNDVLTAWFFSFSGCMYGNMLIDCRNKVPGLSDEHMANYITTLIFHNDEFSATSIRRQLLSPPTSFTSGRQDAPSAELSMAGDCAAVTNWSSSGGDVQLPSSSLLLHYPIQHQLVGINKETGLRSPAHSYMTLFNMGKGELGALVFTRPHTPARVNRVDPKDLPWAGPLIE